MKRRTGKILGLAIGQKSILLAEVVGKANAHAVHRLAELVYPEDISLEKPTELGNLLKQFLRQQKFSARDAVIGLPARRLVTRRKDVPPAPAAAAAATLRLQAESEFSADEGFVMDFAGQTSSSESSSVLLVAASRGCITQCEILAKTAGLRLLAITATGATLARATAKVPGGNGIVVNLAPGGSELIVQHDNAPTQIRHLNMGDAASTDSLGLLAGEIRRSVAALPRNGSPLTLAIWNADGANGTRNLLEQRLAMPVTAPELRTIAETADGDNKYAPAVALAVAALEPAPLPVDFLDSRLAPPPPPSKRNTIVYSVLAGILVLVLVYAAWDSLSSDQKKLAADKAQLNAIKDRVEQAQTELTRLNLARAWSPGKPRLLACLRDLTNLFPEEGNALWASTFTAQPLPGGDFRAQLAGKARTEQEILHLRDRMAANPHFVNINLPDMRQDNSRGTNEITFSISFLYRPDLTKPANGEPAVQGAASAPATNTSPSRANARGESRNESRSNSRFNNRSRRSREQAPAVAPAAPQPQPENAQPAENASQPATEKPLGSE